MTRRTLILTLALGCTLLAGCRCFRRQPPPAYCPPGSSGGSLLPPQNIPVGPPPPAVGGGGAPPLPPPPAGGGGGTELLLPQSPPPGTTRSQYPRVVPADPPAGGAILGDPDYAERPKAVEGPVDPAPPPTMLGPDPPVTPKQIPGERPTGIDEFAEVKEGVNAGRRPTLEGLDWLQAKGYKTVVHVRRPQDADETDRRQVERRGMKFVSLTVTPETLTQDWIDEFNRVIGDTGARPEFVYGQDPQTAAVVWYLHLRTAAFLTHDEARVLATRLGLTDEKSDLFKAALKVAPPNP